MSQTSQYPKVLIGLAVLITAVSVVVSFLFDPRSVWSGVLTSLIWLGPSAIVSGIVLLKVKARQAKEKNILMLSVILAQLGRMVALGRRVVDVVEGIDVDAGRESKNGAISDGETSNPRSLEQLRMEVSSLYDEFTVATSNPKISPRDRHPWKAKPEFFEFPDFTATYQAVVRMELAWKDSWPECFSLMIHRWYETVPVFFEVGGFPNKLRLYRVSGIDNARAEIFALNNNQPQHVTLSSGEYLMVVQEGFRNTLHLLNVMVASLDLNEKERSTAVELSSIVSNSPLNLSRIASPDHFLE